MPAERWEAIERVREPLELLVRVDDYAANETTDSDLVELLLGQPDASADAALACLAVLEEALEAAERLPEWFDLGDDYDECPFCGQSEASEHVAGCPRLVLNAALAACRQGATGREEGAPDG